MKKRLPILALTVLTGANAQNITFGKIQSPKAFQQYWGLDRQQMQTYENYMQVAGRFRHTHVNPLVVMSMIADDAEDKEYFAQKAAKYEADMVQREILSAWLTSNAMQKLGLTDEMARFSSKLTGIEASKPSISASSWKDGDELVILVDNICLDQNCLKQFIPILEAVPSTIPKTVVAKLPKDSSIDADYQQMFKTVQSTVTELNNQRYDNIEHAYLDGIKNQAAHVRNNIVIKKY